MTPRGEPLLWLQLIALGVMPLEALLLLLVLAGSEPGPLPGLERLLCWAIGALAPSLLLARRPADVWSLLLLQTPLRGRRELQRRLSRLQAAPGLALATAGGAVLALPLLWWIDGHAAVAAPITPFASCPRLVALLLAALLLVVMLWQWQQLIQSLWLLSRSPEVVAATRPLSLEELEQERLCLGLPLLLPEPLKLAEVAMPPAAEPPPEAQMAEATPEAQEPEAPPAPPPTPAVELLASEPSDAEVPDAEPSATEPSTVGAVAVEPEQPPEEAEGSDLDQEIG
ncbi:low-complexity tail membrane protein [Cyanobium sp. N.Huapi 1H5]|uniref:low-complexity tail membrane protein n=1 Tax=Cyanobium sp. N.Huapi 1H5 TaxID=2823719 RepID=UPI0020CC6741|nr:low-complexity tail membrane protein [Cyanobium sp. N.Huapi 1H5]MCP9838028.1 low-complexity tail membrane protein [Cyanobium sp. N.Huapi 1H5]